MLIRSRKSTDPAGSEITPEQHFLSRRRFLRNALLGLPLSAITWEAVAQTAFTPAAEDPKTPSWLDNRLHQRVRAARLAANERLTPFEDFASYCNFYEFGTGKDEPARNALGFTVHPWSVRIDGEVERPGAYGLEDLLRGVTLEDRIYRLRCVEAWSMVVPWVGFPLSAVLRRVAPNSRGKYVVFETLHDPRRMPGQREPWLHWPYVEGLRIDEAMHPLTILAVGAYGRSLLPQNGAPLRLVVPWKYGFKSIKSIVRIGLVERPPRTTWSDMAPDEYGFLANVNPAVDHPRWSQRRERRLPTSFFAPNWIETQPFNGYGEQVAGLYRGIDLRRHF